MPLLKALNVFCSLGHFLQTVPDIPYRHPYRRENQKIPDGTGYGYRTTGPYNRLWTGTVYSPNIGQNGARQASQQSSRYTATEQSTSLQQKIKEELEGKEQPKA
ncbi:hypothetical protein C8J56DRAFT_897771 [Mycena floridula]|nr:hypothetical protein C8J56DRAFT_897771 [Mycena floridula]